MEDNDYISSDPWGLPVDAEPAGEEAQPATEEAVAYPADVDTGEPESSQEEVEADELDETEAELSTEPAVGPETEEELTEAVTEPVEGVTETESEEELTEAATETVEAVTEPVTEEELTEAATETVEAVTETGVEDVQPISQAHSAARNVLDALGVGLSEEDLPEEPPAWMDEPAEAAATPPSVYQELSSLGDEATEAPDDLEPIETAIDQTIEEPSEATDDLDDAIDEEPVDLEPIETAIDQTIEEPSEATDDLDDAIDEEPVDLEPIETAIDQTIEEPSEATDDLDDAIDEAPDDLEPIETAIDETIDLETMEAAISAIAIEGDDAADTVVDLEPGDLQDVIEQAIDEGPTEEPVETMEAAISAIATEPGEAIVEPTEEATDLEDAIDETVDLETMEAAISAIATEGDDAADTVVDLEPGDLQDVIEQAIDEGPTEEPVETMEAAISAIGIEPGDAKQSPEEPVDIEPVEEAADLSEATRVIGATGEPPGESSVTWGAEWQDAAQGWVQQEGGRSTWRPIVTTTPGAGAWEIDTFLGLVAGDAMATETDLPSARNRAIRSMVDQALARGAHAVVGVRIEVSVGESTHVGAVGTAVTLKSPT